MSLLEKLKAETAERTYELENDALTRYAFAIPYAAGKDVLDVGTGLGHGAWLMAKNSAKSAVGVDYSEAAINEANRRYSLPNLKFVRVNALENGGVDLGKFDVVLAYEIIEHLTPEDGRTFLKRIKAHLRDGGQAILSTPNKLVTSPHSKPTNPYHLIEYTPEGFRKLLGEYFSNVELRGIQLQNKSFIQEREAFKKSLHYKLVAWATRFRIVHEACAFLPKSLKRKLSGEAKMPELSDADFGVRQDAIEECDILLAICKA